MAEMAESMCASWLRHVKRCSVVQTNWKPSFQWTINDEAFVREALNAACLFFHEHGFTIANPDNNGEIDFYKTMMQTECDVLGISTENEQREPHYFAVESAFHGDGLDSDYALRVASKVVRISLGLYFFCGVKHVMVAFATPTICPMVFRSVSEQIELARQFFQHDCFLSRGINIAVELYTNVPDGYRRYDKEIVELLCWMNPLVSDLSDPFLRAVSLRDMTIGGCRVHGSNLRLALNDLGIKAEQFFDRCSTYAGIWGMIQELHDTGGSRSRAIREFVSWMRKEQLNGALLTNAQIQRLAQEEHEAEAGGAQDNERDDAGFQERPVNRHRTFDIIVNDLVVASNLRMRPAALEAVRRYVEKENIASIDELRLIFGKEVNRYHETIIDEVSPHDSRRYKGPIVLSNGNRVLVCGEWIDEPSPRANWPLFIQRAHDVGVEIVQHIE